MVASCNTFEDSRFAGTVRTYECKDFPFVQLDIDFSDQRLALITYSKLVSMKKIGFICIFHSLISSSVCES